MELTILESVRTNNFTDSLILDKITNAWKQAIEKTAEYVGIKYGIYHNYENNYKGDYTLSIAVEKLTSIQGEQITISEEGYRIFTVDTSKENSVFLTWKEIWDLEEQGAINREYSYDYEKYYPTGKIEIYIKIKE